MGRRIRVGLVFGGKSGEHEVSVRSAQSIADNLNADKYQVVKILIGKDGKMDEEKLKAADVVFPVAHGTFGEDGCLQGLLEMLDKPYVGAGVLGSAVGMDKDVMKRLLSQANIPVAKWEVAKKWEVSEMFLKMVVAQLKFPVFVKPANLGSSVGITKAHDIAELRQAVQIAGQYDTKIIFEENIV